MFGLEIIERRLGGGGIGGGGLGVGELDFGSSRVIGIRGTDVDCLSAAASAADLSPVSFGGPPGLIFPGDFWGGAAHFPASAPRLWCRHPLSIGDSGPKVAATKIHNQIEYEWKHAVSIVICFRVPEERVSGDGFSVFWCLVTCSQMLNEMFSNLSYHVLLYLILVFELFGGLLSQAQ